MSYAKFALTLIAICLFNGAFAAESGEDNTGKDDTQVFHVFKNVNLISAIDFQYGKPRIMVKSVYPQLETDQNTDSVESFNLAVQQFIQDQVKFFKENVSNNADHMKNLDASDLKNNLFIDYDSSSVLSGEDHLVSIRFSIQGNLAGLTHPYHVHRVLNYNLDDMAPIVLADLFKEDSDYLTVISDYVRPKLMQNVADKNAVIKGTEPTDTNFENWNIKPDGLLFTFENFQTGQDSIGPQVVLVPYTILKPLLDTDAPVMGCVKHVRRCYANNVLTGGFIDQTAVNTHHRCLNPILGKL